MEIIDLTEKYYNSYFCCLEDWSDEMKEAGDHKETWFQKMKDKGLRVKIALIDEKACGMIQYIPAENSIIEGKDLYLILCIWVHGYKKGIGNLRLRSRKYCFSSLPGKSWFQQQIPVLEFGF